MEDADLLTNVAVALAIAFAGGLFARRIGIPSVVGYLIAGVFISPFTPGPSADSETLSQVAELGVIFLMFGIGLSFDLEDLLAVRWVAIPGALLWLATSTVFGILIASGAGLPVKEGMVLGFAMAICSSAVMSRSLLDKGLVRSAPGRIAVGWSVAEDITSVFVLALIPALASHGNSTGEDIREALFSLGRAVVFLSVTLIGGRLVIPHVLRYVAGYGSRELFIVAVVSLAMGIAAGATAFEVSFALGAFVAGVVISETELGHQATADVVPLREAFAVLFFVSVGTLLEPDALVQHVGLLTSVVLVVVVGKPVLITALFAAFPHSGRTALIVGAVLANIGEFSFLVANAGLSEGVLSEGTYNIVLAAAVVSIVLNPLIVNFVPGSARYLEGAGPIWRLVDRQGPVPDPPTHIRDHVIVLGFGRVGELVGHAMDSASTPMVVVEGNLELARRLSKAGRLVVWGDAANSEVLNRAHPQHARLIVITLPDESSTVLAVTNLRRVAPGVPLVARARTREEMAILRELEVIEVVVPEYEGGLELMRQSLIALGHPDEDVEGYRLAIRDIHYLLDLDNHKH